MKIEGVYLILNADNKLELHTGGRDVWAKLPEEFKSAVKSSFIWGRQRGAWVSRSKGGNMPWRLRNYEIEYRGAKDLMDFEQAKEREAERRENKADRLEARAERQQKIGAALRGEFDRLRGDWSWLTQPNVNSSRGRAFTRQREKVYARYDRGMQATIYADKLRGMAEGYRTDANEKQLRNEQYLINRIKENKKILSYVDDFYTRYKAQIDTIDDQPGDMQMYLQGRINRFKLAGQKLAYYTDAMDRLEDSRREKGQTTLAEVDERMKSLKKELAPVLKEKYGLKLLALRKAFGKGQNSYFVIATDKDLPDHLQSGWAVKNKAQLNVMGLLREIEKFNEGRSGEEKEQAEKRLAQFADFLNSFDADTPQGRELFTEWPKRYEAGMLYASFVGSPYRDEAKIGNMNTKMLIADLENMGYERKGSFVKWMDQYVPVRTTTPDRLRMAKAKAAAAAARIRILKLKEQ